MGDIFHVGNTWNILADDTVHDFEKNDHHDSVDYLRDGNIEMLAISIRDREGRQDCSQNMQQPS